IEGFLESAAGDKWLELHGLEHWTEYYTDYGVSLQKRFFGHVLKGEDTGWSKQPRVQMLVRHPGGRLVPRDEHEWPLARTRWTRFYLDPADAILRAAALERDASLTYRGLSAG